MSKHSNNSYNDNYYCFVSNLFCSWTVAAENCKWLRPLLACIGYSVAVSLRPTGTLAGANQSQNRTGSLYKGMRRQFSTDSEIILKYI